MKTKLLGILSVSGGMLISSHAFGEDIMGYSKEKLQESVQETAYKFWEHCHEEGQDKGKIGGLEFLKPEEVTPGGKPEPEKKPDPGAANKWEGVSWEEVKATDDEAKKKEYGQYVVANKLPLPTGLSPVEEQRYFKLKKVDKSHLAHAGEAKFNGWNPTSNTGNPNVVGNEYMQFAPKDDDSGADELVYGDEAAILASAAKGLEPGMYAQLAKTLDELAKYVPKNMNNPDKVSDGEVKEWETMENSLKDLQTKLETKETLTDDEQQLKSKIDSLLKEINTSQEW